VRDEALWRYELQGRSPQSCEHREIRVIETSAGEPVGSLAHGPRLWGSQLGVGLFELKSGVSWLAVAPSVLRYVQATGEAYAERDKKKPFDSYGFWLGAEHPAYQVIPDRLPVERKPYAWYVRVPDLPGFLRHIAPALERRLAGSIFAGHTGEVKIHLYRRGMRLAFAEGKLTGVDPWFATHADGGSAGFPDLTFLQMVFGHRTREELGYAFADCWVENDGMQALLNTLFPKRPSSVWPVS
jgi:hypothetical protein